jgi:hypothetical protein
MSSDEEPPPPPHASLVTACAPLVAAALVSAFVVLITTVDDVAQQQPHLSAVTTPTAAVGTVRIPRKPSARQLTVLSCLHNPWPRTTPSWVDRLLGPRAVRFLADRDLTHALLKYPLPAYARWPMCSMELFGLLQPDCMRDTAPPIGLARLTAANGTWDSRCYYRRGHPASPNGHQPLFFHCPAWEQQTCDDFQAAFRGRPFDASVAFVSAAANGTEDVTPGTPASFHVTNTAPHMSDDQLLQGIVTACLVRPRALDSDEARALSAAWAQYHAGGLGFAVLAFDADAAAAVAPALPAASTYLHHPHTAAAWVHGGVGNTDDDDQGLTLTHCRFEAKARYGAEVPVLVADTDAFLWCPHAGAPLVAQHAAVRAMVAAAGADGLEQVTLPVLRGGSAATARRCVLAAADPAAMTVCLAELAATATVPSTHGRALHLAHVCPRTDAAGQACGGGGPDAGASAHDCLCHARALGVAEAPCAWISLQY